MNIPFYNLWSDAFFYIYFAAFAGALAFMVYAIRRWLELKNEQPYEEEESLEESLQAPSQHEELPAGAEAAPEPAPAFETAPEPAPEAPPQEFTDPEKTVVVPNIEEMMAQASEEAAAAVSHEAAPEPELAPAYEESRPAPAAQGSARAEEFVRGIYGHIAGIETRLGAIEDSIARGGGNRQFAVKFLEGLLEDYDSLSVAKIKARVEYLISDLKENQDRPAD